MRVIFNAPSKQGVTMKKIFKIISIVLGVLILAGALWWFFGRNSNALWHIVDQECVPNQQKNGNPSPCIKVDLEQHYVLFKDSAGPDQDLVMPTDKISGIESPILQTDRAYPYFSDAWDNRSHLSVEAGKPLKDQWIALAINSKYGRSQNQLHIHVACLRQNVYNVLNEEAQSLDQDWKPLAKKLVGHQYLARKLAGTDLTKEDPFHLLNRYAVEHGDAIGDYGLALTVNAQGEIILLATRLNLLSLDLGSASEIQDHQCAVAK